MSIKFIHRAYIIIYFTIGRGGLYDSYLQFSRSVIWFFIQSIMENASPVLALGTEKWEYLF